MRLISALLFISVSIAAFANFVANAGSKASSENKAAVESLDRKLSYIQQNGALAHPNSAPTQLTEHEVNAYLASGRVRLPAGVQSLRLRGEPGVITANCRVDFDEFKAGQRSSNPLLSVFSGVHEVVVVAHAHAAGHEGFVHVDSVSLDGVEIPHFALELFVEKYIQPRYPGIGIDSRFALPDKIDTATVGQHQLAVTQK